MIRVVCSSSVVIILLGTALYAATTMNRAAMSNKKPFYFIWHNENNSFSIEFPNLPDDAPSLKGSFFLDYPTEKWKTHSQQDSQQDVLVSLLLKDKSKGFFVDLAANHYKARSNSYNIEQYDYWNGVCIEPNPAYLLGLLSHRKCLIFINPVSDKLNERVKFRFHHDGLFGGIVGEDFDNKDLETSVIQSSSGNNSVSSNNTSPLDVDSYLYTVTLETVLDFVEAPRVIDYLSLDVEGAEENVLRHFNFSKYNFSMITVERPNIRLHNRLIAHGYLFVYTLKGGFGDCLYIHHTIGDVQAIMKKYHSPSRVPGWDRHHRPYLLHPTWNSSIYNTASYSQ